MDTPVAERIAHILRRHPAPAHALSAIPPLLDGEVAHGPRTQEALLDLLRRHPNFFRILGGLPPESESRHARVRENALTPAHPLSEPWVIPLGVPAEAWSGRRERRTPRTVLAESIRHLSASIDPGSFTALCRWARIVGEAHRLELSRRPGSGRSTSSPPAPPL